MKMKLTLIGLTFYTLICFIDGLIEEQDCVTPTGLFGTCAPINECQKLLTLIKGTRADRERLKEYHCGFVGDIPKVCCTNVSTKSTPSFKSAATMLHTVSKSTTTLTSKPTTTKAPSLYSTCYTLEATPGTCVELLKCPELLKRLTRPVKPKELEYVQRNRCIGPGGFIVCCEKPWTNDAEIIPNSTDSTKKYEILERSTHHCQTAELPDPKNGCCGIDTSSGNKIIHGETASIDQFPWLAIIVYKPSSRNYKSICGGSLINSRYVLTAAHCIVTNTKVDMGAKSVRLGEYNIQNDGADCVEVEGDGEDCTNGASTFDISKKIVHPEYNGDTIIVQKNDIALLKLNDTAPYNDFIRPICLPMSDFTQSPPNNMRFYVAGWGAVDQFRSSSNNKLYTDVPYVNFTICQSLYRQKYTGIPIVWNKQICAGGEYNKDTCKGDSGGPLMYLNDKNYELTGITSFGAVQCGSQGVPSIYTKVHEYIPWIKRQINS